MPAQSMEELVSLCKRRGFIFQGSEIYGGLRGTYDYGPLGVELKKNLKEAWWRAMVYERDDIEGLDAAILMNRLVWKYSGHEGGFHDLLVECKKCHHRMRADHMTEKKCDQCGATDLTEAKQFSLMLKTNIGPVEDENSFSYLRPETCQGIFVNFKNVLDSTSKKIPFGIAQIGKSFRNEITPKNFIFRVREFEQMEMQYFVTPGEDETFFKTWQNARLQWWQAQGLDLKHLKIHPHGKGELAHYAKEAVDIEYHFPHGMEELEGVHNRTDYDLGSHTKAQKELGISAKVMENTDSNTKLSYTDPQEGKSFVPFVIETSAGVDRGMLAILSEAYTHEKLDNGAERIVLKLKPHLAPIKVAVIPLARNNEELVATAKKIKDDLQKLGLGRILFENSGNIGKNYRRHDEIGTPVCVTVDFETLEKKPQTVTIRDRDTMEQKRLNITELTGYIQKIFEK